MSPPHPGWWLIAGIALALALPACRKDPDPSGPGKAPAGGPARRALKFPVEV